MISALWACLLYLMIISGSGSNLANKELLSRVASIEESLAANNNGGSGSGVGGVGVGVGVDVDGGGGDGGGGETTSTSNPVFGLIDNMIKPIVILAAITGFIQLDFI
jgi:hypothetical protein